MFDKLISKIKKYRELSKERREIELKEKKDYFINLLNRDWTDEEVYRKNESLIIDSAGWLGGDYTEYDFKKRILRDYQEYFTKEEYQSLYQMIKEKEELYLKHFYETKENVINELTKNWENDYVDTECSEFEFKSKLLLVNKKNFNKKEYEELSKMINYKKDQQLVKKNR